MGSIYLEGYINKRAETKERKALELASRIATEAVINVRTVHSLGKRPFYQPTQPDDLTLLVNLKIKAKGSPVTLPSADCTYCCTQAKV